MTSIFEGSTPQKQGLNSNQDKGHSGSIYLIYTYRNTYTKHPFKTRGHLPQSFHRCRRLRDGEELAVKTVDLRRLCIWDWSGLKGVDGFTGWWLQIFFMFTPKIWGRGTQFDEHIFQRGWFNHQPVQKSKSPV